MPDRTSNRRPPDVELRELLSALSDVMQRAEMFSHHRVESETLSVRERMSLVLAKINASTFTEFTSLFPLEEGDRVWL